MPFQFECGHCHSPIIMSAIEPGKGVECPRCEKMVIIPSEYIETNLSPNVSEDSILEADDAQSIIRLSYKGHESKITGSPSYRTGAIDVLGIFAWISLIVGIIGAIIIWSKYGGDSYESNIAGIFVGIAVLIESILSCAFFLVISNIAENLAAIRKNTTEK